MNDRVDVVKTSGLAVCSLVLGILSLMCFGAFTGLPAIVCGHIAQSSIKNSNGTISGSGLAIGGLITGYIGTILTTIAVLGIIAGMMLPAVSMARERARRTQGMSNLKHIGLSCQMYAIDNDEKFPSSFKELDAVGTPVLLFKCPATDTQVGDFATVDQWSDYVLVPNKTSNDPANDILAFSKPECYSDRGGNVLFVDGSVQWCTAEEYVELTAEFF